MGLLDAALGALGLDQLFNYILNKFPALRQLLDLGQKIIEHFTGVFQAGVNLFNSAQSEFEAWKHFKEDIRFKQIVIVVEVLDTIRNLIDTAQDIVNVIASVREFLQGDFLFLQQRNRRQVLKLESGGSIKIRVGNLHS